MCMVHHHNKLTEACSVIVAIVKDARDEKILDLVPLKDRRKVEDLCREEDCFSALSNIEPMPISGHFPIIQVPTTASLNTFVEHRPYAPASGVVRHAFRA